MRGENTTIRCDGLSSINPFHFQHIRFFQISDITSTGCPPLRLSQITNASIVNASFHHMLSRCLEIQSSSVLLKRSTFARNSARWSYCWGGVIDSEQSTISVEQCSFRYNKAVCGSIWYSFSNKDGWGGAIATRENTNITIANSMFIGNSAGDHGGAVYVDGGSISVENSSFLFNSLGIFHYWAETYGGAISVNNINRNSVTINQSNFIGNKAATGGGIFISRLDRNPSDDLDISIAGSSFIDNKASSNRGGGIMYISGDRTRISLHQSSFINNTAGQLGGVLNTNGRNTSILVTESIFANNSAFACAVLSAKGSGLNVAFTRSVFTDNKVSEISSQSDADIQANSGGVACVISASVSISNSSFRNNAASRHAGVLNVEGSTVSIKGSNFQNNQAGRNGGVISTKLSPITLSVTESSFTNNWAGGNGGVMNVVRSGSQLDITDSNFSFNEASQRGGVLAIAGSELNINQTTFYNNTAALGGVISACNSIATVPEVLIASKGPWDDFQCTLYDGNTAATDSSTRGGPTNPRFARHILP